MKSTVADWLLEPADPSIRYRTLVELLDEDPGSTTVQEARGRIAESKPVREILRKMHPDGYWLQSHPRTGITVGDAVAYGSYATTHFCLAYLAELGLDRNHPVVRRAADRYLDLQKPDGDFLDHLSCLNGYNIRTFVMFGYQDDTRLAKTIDLMLSTRRHDGGYLCDMHDKKRKRSKSCIRGCGKMLMAYAMLPELWEHERCKELVEYFLRRECVFKQGSRDEYVNKDMTHTVFPIVWRTSPLEILWALSRMGLGRHGATDAAWELLDTKRSDDGRYILDWTPAGSPLKAGRRGQPNKWITFYALQAAKYRNEAARRMEA